MNSEIAKKIKEIKDFIASGKTMSLDEHKTLSNDGGVHLFTFSIVGQHRLMKTYITLLKKLDVVVEETAFK